MTGHLFTYPFASIKIVCGSTGEKITDISSFKPGAELMLTHWQAMDSSYPLTLASVISGTQLVEQQLLPLPVSTASSFMQAAELRTQRDVVIGVGCVNKDQKSIWCCMLLPSVAEPKEIVSIYSKRLPAPAKLLPSKTHFFKRVFAELTNRWVQKDRPMSETPVRSINKALN